MTLLIIIIILSLILLSLLVLPIRLIINSSKQRYYIEMPFYLRLSLITTEPEHLFIRLRLFLIPVKVDLRKKKNFLKKSSPAKKKEKRSFTGNMPIHLLKAFTVKRAFLNIDTGDFPLNALLIPIAQTVSSGNVQMKINFENKTDVDINIFTRFYKLVRIRIINNINHKK